MKNKIVKILLIVVVLFLVWNIYQSKKFSNNLELVEDVNLEKYEGTWYEVGSIPTWFQRGLSNVTATYNLYDDGTIGVLNKGFTDSGKVKSRYATAELTDVAGRLKVNFNPVIGAEYNILYVDEFYSYALVGGGDPKYLWVLSRTPELDERVVTGLLERAEDQGYLVDRFETKTVGGFNE